MRRFCKQLTSSCSGLDLRPKSLPFLRGVRCFVLTGARQKVEERKRAKAEKEARIKRKKPRLVVDNDQ
jgi:hypothetical protein